LKNNLTWKKASLVTRTVVEKIILPMQAEKQKGKYILLIFRRR
jgi:hypothetical protein